MPQDYLSDNFYNNHVYYNMNFQNEIDAYAPPRCPGTFEGESQYYDANTKQCVPINPATFSTRRLAGSVSPSCGGNLPGGNPFHMDIGGRCYSTNSCPTSSDLSEECLNGQQVVVRENPLVGPGVICGGCYNECGDASADWWKWV